MADLWAWALEHPAEAAWLLYGVVAALVAAVRAAEPELKALAAKTAWTGDDRIVAFVGVAARWASFLFAAVELVAPKFVGFCRRNPPNGPRAP